MQARGAITEKGRQNCMASILERYAGTQKASFAADTVLLQEGTRSGKIIVLASGGVSVKRGEIKLAAVTEPGSIFGEMSLLLDVPHTASVTAEGPVEVYVFHDAEAFLRSDPEIALIIAKMLAQRLHSVTTYLVDIRKQYADQKNHLGMVSEVLAGLAYQHAPEFTPGSDRLPDPGM